MLEGEKLLMSLEYYKLIRNSVQLKDVELLSTACEKRDFSKDDEYGIVLSLQRGVKLINPTECDIVLKAEIGFEGNGPFSIEVVYKGTCFLIDPQEEENFEKYCYDQVVPLLLPYAREFVATTLARMGLPIYTIPTMDVLDSLGVNSLDVNSEDIN